MGNTSPSTSFICRRVNSTTFLIVEDDSYEEHPYIYVKIYPNHLLITDTGCNSPRYKEKPLTLLREYIETFPLAVNKGQSLNPGAVKSYVIICSHCHYDHILGIPQFLSARPDIVASGFDKNFILKDLPKHSLCKYLGISTPKYVITHWAGHMESLSISDKPFRIQFLHVPGHTPDSLAWYDIDEQHLYVGDTFYERQESFNTVTILEDFSHFQDPLAALGAIIFPEDGNWINYMSSLDVLLSFVRHQNQELQRQYNLTQGPLKRVKVACGHSTYDRDAEQMLLEVQDLFERIIKGQVPVTSSGLKRGTIHDYWLENDNARYSVLAPHRLVEEARKYFSTP
ncbi:beta-lactamase-like protein [Tricladium varicosporioides]|nr:beta-lactamase-like protein [Hymenoscyphus varicosporioides]